MITERNLATICFHTKLLRIVSFFIATMTNYHQPSGLRQYPLTISQFRGLKVLVQWGAGELLLRVPQGQNHGGSGVASPLEDLGMNPLPIPFRLLQDSAPCAAWAEAPVSLLAVSWEPLSSARPPAFITLPLLLQTSKDTLNPHALNPPGFSFSLSFSWLLLEKILGF